MILFWIFAAALTAAVALVLTRPLLRPAAPAASRAAHDSTVYRDQLAELERELAQGLIGAAEAEAARSEIGRRLLGAAEAAEAADAAPPAPPAPGNRRLALGVLGLVPLLALGTYLLLGRPDLPDQPFAGRDPAAERQQAPPDVMKAVAALAERLKREQPDDLEGWMLLAQSLGKLGRPAEAVEAWRQAVRLAPDEPSLSGGLAEALTTANQGMIPDEARRLFEAILAKFPEDPRAAHYLALARAQAGDFQGALERWVALARATPADAPWLPMVQTRIRDMAARLKLDPANVLPSPRPAE